MQIGVGTIVWFNRYSWSAPENNKRMKAVVTEISLDIDEEGLKDFMSPYISMVVLKEEGPVETLHFYLSHETIKNYGISTKCELEEEPERPPDPS